MGIGNEELGSGFEEAGPSEASDCAEYMKLINSDRPSSRNQVLLFTVYNCVTSSRVDRVVIIEMIVPDEEEQVGG